MRQAAMQQAQEEMQQEQIRQQQRLQQQQQQQQQQAYERARQEEEARYYQQQQQAAYAEQQALLMQQQRAQQQQQQQQQQAGRKSAHQIAFEQQEARKKQAAQMATSATLDDATTLAEKGTIMMSKGNYADALALYDKCLSIQLAHLGDRHPIVAHTIDLMGVALLRLGNGQEALETFEKSVYIYEQSSGHGTPDWALTVLHCGQAFELMAENTRKVSDGKTEVLKKQADRDNYQERAYEMYEKALDVFQSRADANEADLDVANVVMAMGNIHNMRGEYMEALRKYKFSLEHKIALLGEEDPSVGWSKNNIGNSFKGLGKYDEAIKWYQEALTTVTKHYGPEHPEVGHVHWNLGLCYQSKGQGDASKRQGKWTTWPWKYLNWLQRFATVGLEKRIAHEGEDFEKMGLHLHHAFDVFLKRLGEDHISTTRAMAAMLATRELTRD